eukprot:symbB.v1.2.027764.t1/scaffold2862.1/size68630/4
MPAGSTGSFPRSADSRTTAKHVFKPPESGGTVSQSRADRWQKATGKAQSRSPSPSPKKNANPKPSGPSAGKSTSPPPRGAARSPVRSPAPKVNATSPPLVQKPMARDALDFKKVVPPADMEEKWMTWEPLNPQPGRHGPKDFGPPRLGMSHPPMNTKVRKELLAYLYARKVRPPKRVRKEKREDEIEADSFSPADFRAVQEQSIPDQRQGRAKRLRTKSSSLPLLRDLRSPTEEQVGIQTEILRQNSRYLGWELNNREVSDLGELTIYHNKMLRRHSPIKQQASPAQKLSQLRISMAEHSLQSPLQSPRLAKRSMTLSSRLPRHEDTGPLTTGGDASPARLRRLAHQIEESAGPGRVQLMARAVGLNVATGNPRRPYGDL